MSSDWRVEYDNDTGPGDEGFFETWTVTDGTRSFRADSDADATWLLAALQSANPSAVEAIVKWRGVYDAFSNIMSYVRSKDDLYANGAIRQFAEEGLAAMGLDAEGNPLTGASAGATP